jgi:hypothetical protein
MKHYQTAVIFSIVLFFALFVKANAQACGTYYINITVEDEQNQPVKNASVKLLPIEKDETEGKKFVLDKAEPSKFSISLQEGHDFKTFHKVLISAPGFKESENKVRFISCENRNVVVKLAPLKSASEAIWQFENEIDIQVFGGDGKTLPGVKMQILGEKREPENIEMGQWGSAFLTLPNGKYRFKFEKPGYETKEITADLTPLANEHLKVELKPKEN